MSYSYVGEGGIPIVSLKSGNIFNKHGTWVPTVGIYQQ